MSDRRGFTLIEIIIALVLFGIVGAAIYQLLISNQRLYREQTEQIGVNQTVRSTVGILPSEFREMNAGDPAGSDVVALGTQGITYKAMRSLYFLCQDALVGSMQLVLDANRYYGLQELSAARDSVVIFAEGDDGTRMDDQWLHADVTFVATGGADCPLGEPSVTITVAGPTATELGGVYSGSPVRGFEVIEASLYGWAGGYWMGARRAVKGGGWTDRQPVVGPMTDTGLTFTYLDASGTVTATPAAVARIGIAVEGTSDLPLVGRSLNEALVTSVALRNNPVY